MATDRSDVTASAEALLASLVGKDVRTFTGRLNRIIGVRPPYVLVATDRSPGGRQVRIAEVQAALDMLREDGSVEIDPPVIGHRSSFIGAVLVTIPGARFKGSAPPRVALD